MNALLRSLCGAALPVAVYVAVLSWSNDLVVVDRYCATWWFVGVLGGMGMLLAAGEWRLRP